MSEYEPRSAGPARPPEIDFSDYAAPLRDKTDAELRAANFVFRTIQSPWMMRVGRMLARLGLALRVPGTESAIRYTVFRQFCGGISLEEAAETSRRLYEHGIGTILDYAAEGEASEAGFDHTRDQLLGAIDYAAERPEVAFFATKMTGMARFDLLAKKASGEPLDAGEREELDRAVGRLEEVASRARDRGMPVFIDAEHSWIQGAIDEVVERLMRAYNRERPFIHTTVQLYLRDRLGYLERLIEDARRRGYILGVKLVRGAYMEQEHEHAAARGEESPVQPSKADTDAAFDRAITLCLENLDAVALCAASHNIESTRHLMAEMARLGIERTDPRVTVSQLLGMLDRVTFPLAAQGYNALKYVPYGDVRDAFPYLLRRADENKSVATQIAGEHDAVREELRRRGRRAL